MTALLDRAIHEVRSLTPDSQADIAHLLLARTGADDSPLILSASEKQSLEKSLAQAARGEFASDEVVAAIWVKHGL